MATSNHSSENTTATVLFVIALIMVVIAIAIIYDRCRPAFQGIDPSYFGAASSSNASASW
jgi:ABC-type sulfate transport system permease component